MTYLQTGTCYAEGCRNHAARRHTNAWLCPDHAPNPPTPDPARTFTGLMKAAGLTARSSQLSPWALKGGSKILKDRPGGYVSKQRAQRIADGTAERQHR